MVYKGDFTYYNEEYEPMLRIRDVYPRSLIRFLPFPDLKTATKESGEKNEYKLVRKPLLLFCHFFMTFYLWKSNKEKKNFKKRCLVAILKVTDENSRILIWIR